jgi:hypothetical protein
MKSSAELQSKTEVPEPIIRRSTDDDPVSESPIPMPDPDDELVALSVELKMIKLPTDDSPETFA